MRMEDKYNEEIRKKLIGFEPQYTQNDWDDTLAYINASPTNISWWSLYGKSTLTAILGLVLMGSLFYNYKLKKELVTIKSTSHVPVLEKTITEIVNKTDTLYKVKYITKYIKVAEIKDFVIEKPIENGGYAAPQKNKIQSENGPLMISQNEKENIFKTLEKKPIKPLSERSVNAQNESKIELKRDDILAFVKPEKMGKEQPSIEIGRNDASADLSDKSQNKNKRSQIQMHGNSTESNNEKPTIIQKKNYAESAETLDSKFNIGQSSDEFTPNRFITFSPETIASKKLVLNTLNREKAFSTKLVFDKTIDTQPKKERFKINIPRPDFSKLQYRYGISGDLSNEQAGFGLAHELLINDKWGIYNGLRIVHAKGEDYLTSSEYMDETKQDFRKFYAPFVSNPKEILNINFQNYYLQFPLGVNYRYALRKDYKLLFSAGTDLDIMTRESLKFEYPENDNKYEDSKSTRNFFGPVFNNILVGIGLEKNYKNIFFQVQPYFSYQWKRTPYEREEFFYGARLRILMQNPKNGY